MNAFKNFFRAGFTERATELVIRGYRKMLMESCYQLTWGEEIFSAVLRRHVDQCCPAFSRATRQQWDVQREYYKDTLEVSQGTGNPRKVPRIDIVLFN